MLFENQHFAIHVDLLYIYQTIYNHSVDQHVHLMIVQYLQIYISMHGRLHTIDRNEELYDFQKKYFEKSKYGDMILQHVGNALEIIPTLEEKFDLFFIDAYKSNYSNYFNLVIDKMNPGGVILSDNVLWSGKVVEELNPKDIDTKALLKYNKLVNEDVRVETVLLPIRDGLTISRVK